MPSRFTPPWIHDRKCPDAPPKLATCWWAVAARSFNLDGHVMVADKLGNLLLPGIYSCTSAHHSL